MSFRIPSTRNLVDSVVFDRKARLYSKVYNKMQMSGWSLRTMMMGWLDADAVMDAVMNEDGWASIEVQE